jgi:hypothetical protein
VFLFVPNQLSLMTRLLFFVKLLLTLFAISLFALSNKIVYKEDKNELAATNQLERVAYSHELARSGFNGLKDGNSYHQAALSGDELAVKSNQRLKERLQHILVGKGFLSQQLIACKNAESRPGIMNDDRRPDSGKNKAMNIRFRLVAYEPLVTAGNSTDPGQQPLLPDSGGNTFKMREIIHFLHTDQMNVILAIGFSGPLLDRQLDDTIEAAKQWLNGNLPTLKEIRPIIRKSIPKKPLVLTYAYSCTFEGSELYKDSCKIKFNVNGAVRINNGAYWFRAKQRNYATTAPVRDFQLERPCFISFKVDTTVKKVKPVYLSFNQTDPGQLELLEKSEVIPRISDLFGDNTLTETRNELIEHIKRTEENVDIFGFSISGIAFPFVLFISETLIAILMLINVHYDATVSINGMEITDDDRKDWILPLIVNPYLRPVVLVVLPLVTLFLSYPIYTLPAYLNFLFWALAAVIGLIHTFLAIRMRKVSDQQQGGTGLFEQGGGYPKPPSVSA